MRIAVCDDNAVFLQFFKSMLANELESRSVKAEIETFTKAESFFYCHGKKPFSAIFLDLDMPEMTGFEVARQLGQNGNCFVIFVTSHQELVYDSFNFRPLNFICKDPDADVMKDRLHIAPSVKNCHVVPKSRNFVPKATPHICPFCQFTKIYLCVTMIGESILIV